MNPLFFKSSQEYKQLIQESIDGCDILCDSGLMGEFILSPFSSTGEWRVKEMKDSNYFVALISQNPETVIRDSLKLIGKALLMAPFMVPYGRIKRNVGRHGKAFDKAREVRNLEDLRDFRQFSRRMHLPEPLFINSLRFLYGEGYKSLGTKHQNIFNSIVLRSAVQAEEMTRYANENDFEELHSLVGFFHEPQIRYFLEHPEHIDEMKRDNDIYAAGEKWRNSRNQ